jgi:hypothetical protein
MIVAVQNHAGQGNDHRDQGDGHPADPTEALPKPFAEIRGVLRETLDRSPRLRANGFAVGNELAKRSRWGR